MSAHTRRNNTSRPRGAGFTLTELLVVVTVIVLILTVAAPQLGNVLQGSKVDGALSTVKAAVASARAYAGEKRPFEVGSYQGSAIIVTPANELRVTQHIEGASNGATKLVEQSDPRAGYADAGDAYVLMPSGVGLVGIARNSSGAKLLAPPFAIRFNANGHMIVRQGGSSAAAYDEVVYDGNVDGSYGTTTRPANYDPTASDPEVATTAPATHAASGKFVLPFEDLETAVGVIAYSKTALREAGLNLVGSGTGGAINSAAATWLQTNGTIILFNRYTGSAISQ